MSLTTDRARAVLAAAEAKAQEIGVPVVVVIVDAGAHPKAFTRMDGAPLGSIDVAMKKARTAALFNVASEDVWEYCKPGAPAHGLELSNGGLAPFGGGVPIAAGGELVGAVGISGGAVSQDRDIAIAAAAAFAELNT